MRPMYNKKQQQLHVDSSIYHRHKSEETVPRIACRSVNLMQIHFGINAAVPLDSN
jgi:hypothetical protein